MSFEHLGVIAELDAGEGHSLTSAGKLTLYALGNLACKDCGLAWPGVPYLTGKTGLGPTRIRDAIAELRSSGHVKIHAYAKGGRARTTEYVVLPNVIELSTAPCGECGKRIKSHRAAGGLKEIPTARRGVSASVIHKPTATDPENPPRGGDHTVSNTTQSPRERADSVDPSGRTASDPTHPTPAGTARRFAQQLVTDLATNLGMQRRTEENSSTDT